MSKILFFDTETTGLIPKKDGRYNNYYEYTNIEQYDKCRMVSICWKVYLYDNTHISSHYYVIKNLDFLINNNSKAAEINKITQEVASEGTDIQDVFKELYNSLEGVSLIVAHNVSFDMNIISSEFHRYNQYELLDKFRSINTYCTCINGKAVTKKSKIPKLIELYKFLFNKEFENMHNAEADVDACASCYFKMITL